jgi:serine/threonine-protein kinase RsbW
MTMNPASTIRCDASVPSVELCQSLPSRIDAISPAAEQLMRFIANFGNADGSAADIEIALREALANAIVHGNREDPRKRVFLTCRCTTDGEVYITVQDEGPGFEIDSLPDPTVPENRLRATGRGICLMKALMDEVHFEQRGAVVHMRKNAGADSAAERRAG